MKQYRVSFDVTRVLSITVAAASEDAAIEHAEKLIADGDMKAFSILDTKPEFGDVWEAKAKC